jgi:drug/metabolite transporter (DMT)-like permease
VVAAQAQEDLKHMTLTRRQSTLAAGALLVNAFVWGVSWWPFRQLEAQGWHPLWTTAMVYGFAMVCVLIVRPRAFAPMLQNPIIWILALGSGLTNVGFNWAVTIGDVVRVVLLFYLMPAWSIVLAWPLLGERPTGAALARAGLALAGVLLVLKTPEVAWPVPSSLPDFLALAGGFCFALNNVMLRRLHQTPAETRMLAMFIGGTFLSITAALVGARVGLDIPAPAVLSTSWALFAIALAVAFLISNLALQYGASRLRASTTSLVMLSEVLFASLSAIALGAASLSGREVLGGLLIIAAAVWAAASESQQGP